MVRTQRVSQHTEVNFRIIIDRHINLLLRLSRPSIVRRRVVVGDNLHGLFDLLVTLIFEALAIAILAGVYTTTEIIVLWGRRWRPRSARISFYRLILCKSSPIAICWNDVVNSKLLTDLLNTQMENISFKLFICHIGFDLGR